MKKFDVDVVIKMVKDANGGKCPICKGDIVCYVDCKLTETLLDMQTQYDEMSDMHKKMVLIDEDDGM